MNDRELAKKVINDILSSDEFQSEKLTDLSKFNKIKDFINSIIEKINKFIQDILDWFFKLFRFKGSRGSLVGLEKTSEIVITIIGVVLIVVLAMILIKIILKILRKYSFKKDLADELEELSKTPEEPLKLALYYKEKKEYRQSFRYFFIALLVYFNEKDLIKIQRFKTNRIYLRELYDSNNKSANESKSFFQAFDLYWYGKREVNEEILDSWQSRYMYLTEESETGEANEKV